MRAEHFPTNPLITPRPDAHIGDNINGPSVIRVPAWVTEPLGRYYMYFGHHTGGYIRLAYADTIFGPWSIYRPGAISLEESPFVGHIASPDVHVVDPRSAAAYEGSARRWAGRGPHIRMYYHGKPSEAAGGMEQKTACAVSGDGLSFSPVGGFLGKPYFRVFMHEGDVYAISIPGWLYRAPAIADSEQLDAGADAAPFECGPLLFGEDSRHFALLHQGDHLLVFYTVRREAPERIYACSIELSGDWREWKAGRSEVLLEPQTRYEGASLPLRPSRKGPARGPVRELRDPCVYEEDGRIFLFYSFAGEQGIAAAEVFQ